MPTEANENAESDRQYVYGWGRTKHIKNPFTRYPTGLCGAAGGYSLDRPHLPVCKHCQRYQARIDERRTDG